MDPEQESVTEYDDAGDRIIKPRELTAQEKLYMQRAKERHKKNLTKEQPNFKGPSFIAKPERIVFKDFTVGKTHQIPITLTNVSNAFCSFNLVPFNQRIRNFFEVDYIRQGRISPGLSCNLTIKFTPLVNQDIDDFFHILAETGPISYPLLCTSKKTVVTCANTIIDFGKVVFGEKGKTSINLKNLGSLGSEYMFKGPDGTDIFARGQHTLDPSLKVVLQQELSFEKRGYIKGQSNLVIPLEVSPKKVGKESVTLQIHFENFKHSSPIVVQIVWDCVEVPVYIEQQLYDLELCPLGHIYRRKLIFHNRSENPMKVQISQAPDTKKHFEFNPTLGFIQNSATLEVWVKIILDKEFETYLPKYHLGDRVYHVPFKLIAANQLMPVHFSVKLKITPTKLLIKPMNLEFGSIWQGLASKLDITFQNTSELPQQVMLYPIPKNIKVENNQTTFKILPLTSFTTSLTYESENLVGTKSKIDQGAIPVKIVTGNLQTQDCRLSYSAEILRPELKVSKNKIQFPALQVDQKIDTYLQLKNNSTKAMTFEMFLPPVQVSGIKATPIVGTLQPGSSTQVNLEYHSAMRKLTAKTFQKKPQTPQVPEADKLKELPPVEPPKKQGKKQVKKQTKLTKQQQEQLELEEKQRQEQQRQRAQKQRLAQQQLERNFDSKAQLKKYGGEFQEFEECQYYRWVVPIYYRSKSLSSTTSQDASSQITYVEITTTSVQKKLILDSSVLDFGEVAVGTRETRPLRLTNNDQQSQIYKDQLPSFSGFNLLNSLRVLDKGSSFNYLVEFQPNQQLHFEQRLTLRTDRQAATCMLKGKGVRPEIKLDPENGLLPMGSVLLGEYTEKSFKLRNVTNFQLKFKLQTKARGIQNSGPVKAVTCIPNEGFIPANKDIEIKVKFKPDKISEKFYELIHITVPQQKDEKRIYIFGSCYNRQAYFTEQRIPRLFTAEQLPKKLEYTYDTLFSAEDANVYGPSNNKVLIEFARTTAGGTQPEQAFKKKFVVGSCRLLDPKAEKPVNFEIIMPKDQKFACDNVKAAVTGGNQVVVTFTYKPPSPEPLIADVELLKDVGQWKDIRGELKLSGGFVKAGITDVCSIQLILKAYVNQL